MPSPSMIATEVQPHEGRGVTAGDEQDEVAPQPRNCLREGARNAIIILGQGVLDADPALRAQGREDNLVLSALFDELLRTVCRLVFLACLEARGLLVFPTGTEKDRRHAGILYWLERSTSFDASDMEHDGWDSMITLLEELETGNAQPGLPALGGGPSSGGMAILKTARIANSRFLSALHNLGFGVAKGDVVTDWKTLKSGELGTVYESLLELRPYIGADGSFGLDGEGRGGDRRISGSYYTPDSLVEALLDSTLEPVMKRAEAAGGAEAILALRVIDPACGAGHFLLGAARRMARRVASLRAPDAPDFRTALRDVVSRCIHGVDCNPMAIELAKMALWLETGMPGHPLCFMDANIRCGNALLGILDVAALEKGVPDGAYRPLTGDDPAVSRHYLRLNQRARSEMQCPGYHQSIASLGMTLTAIRALPETTWEQVACKRRRFGEWWGRMSRSAFHVACDLYVAAFLRPRAHHTPAGVVPTTAEVWSELAGQDASRDCEYGAVDIARRAHALHWPLAFADVMAGRGGFDVVIGNPPWEVMQLQEEEYFAARAPEIAALKGAARKAAIAGLKATHPNLFHEFATARRLFDAMNAFARASGRFPLTARGKGNTYALFAELFLTLVRRDGRAGLIVPTGIATDAMTAPFLSHLMRERRLAQLLDFENSAPFFTDVHRSFKFCLLTMGNETGAARFACFLNDPRQAGDTRRHFRLTAEEIARINPDTNTMPVFRSSADAELTAGIYSHVPVFINEARGNAGNPWGIEFRQGLFNMTSDSGLFRNALQLRAGGWRREGTDWVRSDRAGQGDDLRYLPLYEAKMGSFYDHRHAGYGRRKGERGHRVLPETTQREHCDPDFEITPHYWVRQEDVIRKTGNRTDMSAFFGFRNIMSPTNERTFICNLLPPWGVGNSMTVMFPRGNWTDHKMACLIGNLSSLPFDFVCRQKAGGVNLNFFIVRQLPVLPPSSYGSDALEFILPRVVELTYASHAMAGVARDFGYDGGPFPWDEDRRAWLRAELDAWYARAYGLSRRQLEYVLDPHDVMGHDYPSQTFRVLRKNEITAYGEYRTRRLVLAAYDQQT